MDISVKELCKSYIINRRQSPSWQLLASRRAPIILSCLKTLFNQGGEGVVLEDALQLLADMFDQHANSDEFEIETNDYQSFARKELRDWIKRGLIVERDGRLLATDPLQKSMQFIDSLDDRIMTSTASRLATVQREIENLESRLNPDRKGRISFLKRKIKELEDELSSAKSGNFDVLEGAQAIEGIREIYNLAISLKADFRRVEDSYREADRQLRQSIISEKQNRGEIVEKLLDGHDNLLETPEGKVFHGFYEQLTHTLELDNMKQRLRTILRNPSSEKALNPPQHNELRWLVTRLVGESRGVIQARARSERDVRGSLRTGLAAEHHRVGELLNEILETGLDIDWNDSAIRKQVGPLPPLPVSIPNLPLIERLRFSSVDQDEQKGLDFEEQQIALDDVDEDFWNSFDVLDRELLMRDTLYVLKNTNQALSISDLVEYLTPKHDLETLVFWISLAREAGIDVTSKKEVIDFYEQEKKRIRFHVPKIDLTAEAIESIDEEGL